MSRRYWLPAVALGLALFLSVGHAQNYDEGVGDAANQAEPARNIPQPLAVVVSQEESERQASRDIQEETNRWNEQNVLAQQGIERATNALKWAAYWQTFFIALGTILVGATLYLMVGANRAATRAAEAAEKSIELTRRNAAGQLRAYLSFKLTQIVPPTDTEPGRFVITIKNHGKTPAFVTRSLVRYKVFEAGEAPKIFFSGDPDDTPTSQAMIFPDDDEVLYLDASIGANMKRIVLEGGSAHVAGVVIYKDAFGVTRRTIFHIVCNRIKRDSIARFHPAGKHNVAS